jgi:hypothetical protein
MTTELEKLKQENEKLRKENRLLRVDSSKRSFFALNRIINQQVDLLNDFDIKSNVEGKKSENASFERTQSIWKELPKLISELNSLRSEMKIDGETNAADDEEILIPISPETMAD